MADQITQELGSADAVRMTALFSEINDRLAEMAAIFAAATGVEKKPTSSLKFLPAESLDGDRRLTTVEIVCDANGQDCGCIVYFPDGRVLVESPCGSGT